MAGQDAERNREMVVAWRPNAAPRGVISGAGMPGATCGYSRLAVGNSREIANLQPANPFV
jgi:hypothetical protein